MREMRVKYEARNGVHEHSFPERRALSGSTEFIQRISRWTWKSCSSRWRGKPRDA